jgi:hypothetical protein
MPPHKDAARPSQARDRANVVALAIISIFVDALHNWLRGEPADLASVREHVERVLRDEFAGIKREAAGERIAGEDAP